MLLFFILLVLSLLFALTSYLIWLALRLLGVRARGKRMVKGTTLTILFFLPVFTYLLLPMIASFLVATASTRRQDSNLKSNPTTYGRNFSEVELHTRNGLTLGGVVHGRRNLAAGYHLLSRAL